MSGRVLGGERARGARSHAHPARSDPVASPAFGDWTGLCPLLIQAGDSEVFIDDIRRSVGLARDAGACVRFEEWRGMFHVFHAFAPMQAEGRWAIGACGRYVQAVHVAVHAANEAMAAVESGEVEVEEAGGGGGGGSSEVAGGGGGGARRLLLAHESAVVRAAVQRAVGPGSPAESFPAARL